MAHEEATPRPWRWEWDCLNSITIFQPSEDLNSVEVAQIGVEDSENEEMRCRAEADAELICTAVNALVF